MAYNHDKGWCWYNLDNNICFIGVPKNASTSIRNGFNLNKMDNYFSLSDGVKSNLKLITVLRDPLDRLVSAYLEVIIRVHDSPKTIGKKFFHMSESIDRFREFITELEQDTYDAHVEHQRFYITDNEDKLLPFFKILSFKNLEEDLIDLKKSISLTTQIPHLNKKNNLQKNMVYNYLKMDNDLLERIKILYKKDYILYNKIIENGK